EMRSADPGQPHRLPDEGMMHLVHRRHPLHLRVLDDQVLDERLVQRDVDVLVDGGRDHEPAVLVVVGGQVGATPAERDAQGTPRDDHAAAPSYTRSTIASAALASPRPGAGGRPARMSSADSANFTSHEAAGIGYSQVVVSGGPMSGSIR